MIPKVSLYDFSHTSDYFKYGSECVDGAFTRKYTQYVSVDLAINYSKSKFEI